LYPELSKKRIDIRQAAARWYGAPYGKVVSF
jgi:hypothetical protein